jgi:hypothetical protein
VSTDDSPIDHSECVAAPWGHRTHNHEGEAGAWLFPSEVPPADRRANETA